MSDEIQKPDSENPDFSESPKTSNAPESSENEGLDALDALASFEKEKAQAQANRDRGAFLDKKIAKKLTPEQKRLLKIMIAVGLIFMVWISWKTYGFVGSFSASKKESGEVIKNNVAQKVGNTDF